LNETHLTLQRGKDAKLHKDDVKLQEWIVRFMHKRGLLNPQEQDVYRYLFHDI
jgi:hypothetical protein